MEVEQERAYREYVGSRLSGWRRVAYLLSQDWHLADDLVQETAVQLYVHWRLASRATSLDAYARTMLIRVFLRGRRTAWSRRVVLVDEVPDRAGAPPDETTRLLMRAALATLAPRQRATLVMRYFCDMSVEETAEAMRCSIGTVKSQSARGLVALRAVYTEGERAVEIHG
jgi:RNA polymerase sigma factor (sigma-70 family)